MCGDPSQDFFGQYKTVQLISQEQFETIKPSRPAVRGRQVAPPPPPPPKSAAAAADDDVKASVPGEWWLGGMWDGEQVMDGRTEGRKDGRTEGRKDGRTDDCELVNW